MASETVLSPLIENARVGQTQGRSPFLTIGDPDGLTSEPAWHPHSFPRAAKLAGSCYSSGSTVTGGQPPRLTLGGGVREASWADEEPAPPMPNYKVLVNPVAGGDGVLALDWSPDGRRLATGTGDMLGSLTVTGE